MSNLFDPQSFLNSAITGALETKRTLMPVGETYGQITKIDMANGDGKDGRKWYRLDCSVEITDSAYLAPTGLEKLNARYSVMLDLNEGGGIAMGPNKNIRLGRLREATGTNQPGKSLSDMVGQFVRLSVTHRPDPEGKRDEKGEAIVYDEISAVAKY